MPGFDNTGPGGRGPRTGRGQGRCAPTAGDTSTEQADWGAGRGYGRGYGRGLGRGAGRGGGRGYGRGFGAGAGRGYGRGWQAAVAVPQNETDAELRSRLTALEAELAALKTKED